jgi:4-amino-4-deoxy-L-arabinose transferase-like glycosyltransferase
MRGDDPRARATAGTGAVSPIPAILILLAIGIALRFIIAYVILPGSGFPNDLASFQGWGNDIAIHGPVGFYDRQGFIDYPPVYLILLGCLSLLTGGNLGEAIKILPILADGALAFLVWHMVRGLGASDRRAFIAAAVVVVNPVTWFNSAIWGQADAVGAIFLLLGLRELMAEHRETASAMAVLSVLTKMQLGILGFIVAFVVLRRSLFPKEGPREPIRILTSIGAGLLTGGLVCLPFTGLDFLGLAERLTTISGLLTVAAGLLAGAGAWALARRFLPVVDEARRGLAAVGLGAAAAVAFAGMYLDSIAVHLINTFGEYPYLTLNAYNPWALVATPDGAAMDRGLSWIRDSAWTDGGNSGTGFLFGPFPTAVVAVALALAAALVVVAFVAWSRARALTPASESAADAPSGFLVNHDWPAELRGIAGAAAVAAGTIGFVFAGGLVTPLPAAIIGDGLLLAVLLGTSAWAAWRDDRLSLVVGLVVLAVAFFVVPTRAHERYLFPFFIVGAILLAVSWRWSVLYVALAVVNSANLLGVLVEYSGIPANGGQFGGTLQDWGTGVLNARWFDGIIWPIALSGVVTGLGMIWVLLQTRGIAAARLELETARAAEPELIEYDYEEIGEPVHSAARPAVPARTIAAARADAAEPAVSGEYDWEPAEYDEYEEDERPMLVPDRVMRIWHRIFRHSDMPDRSRSLDHEGRGRIDKLDIWVVVALVIGILCVRVYRVGEPTDMYFDEVYHARTATEFLQEWKYGIPHDIYEWTHPHFAKYAIGAGIAVFSDDKVKATSDLDHPVTEIYVQPRLTTSPNADPAKPNDPRAAEGARLGDRVFVATGSAVMVYDLETRALEYRYDIPGAVSFTTVGQTGFVYVGASDGHLYRIDSNSLDDVRLGIASTPTAPEQLAVTTGMSNAHIYAGTAPMLIAWDANGTTVSIDMTADGGTVVARATIPGIADMVDLGTGPTTISADPALVTNPSAESSLIADDVTGDAAAIESALSVKESGLQVPIPVGALSEDQKVAVKQQIAAGLLPGVTVGDANPQVLVAYSKGVGSMDARNLSITSTIETAEPATSIAINENDSQDSYVTAGKSILLIRPDKSSSTGTVVKDGFQPLEIMPGTVYKAYYDSATKVVQVLGKTPDGSAWTVYAIETNGNAVFSDAVLPFEPAALGLDSTRQMPWSNREQLLAFSADGSMATVNVGQFAFSWRIMGVFFGAVMAVCLYLLARILFKRRSVGLLVALFTLTDGMFFAQSRIAMNDTYVGAFLLLGYLLFALLWLKVWKGRLAFWLGMPLLGVILGLALFSKWVAAYAIASIGILILIRSALGRLIAILGLAGATGVLGWMAIGEMTTAENTGNPAAVIVLMIVGVLVVLGGGVWATSVRHTADRVAIVIGTAVAAAVVLLGALSQSPGSVDNGAPNYTFFVVMLAVTTVAAATNALHPVAWAREELRFAIGAPIAAGILLVLAGPLLAGVLGLGFSMGTLVKLGAVAVAAGPAIGVAFWVGGRFGFGPLAVPPAADDPIVHADPPSPSPEGWLRLGSGKGLHAAWMGLTLLALPLLVYILMYIPWSMPWQAQTDLTGNLPVLWCFSQDVATGTCAQAFPANHTGQSLWDLTQQMYNYHNNLRASHAASSPWWAWPFDLKPVWFQSQGYANEQSSMIYDGGNPALWWLAVGAMGFLFWQAFRRRSLALTLIAVAFAWQWLSWSRIDRAAFQYHFYTALPFFLMGLAYFLAELWHGPSKRTWLFARLSAAAALIFPTILWLFKSPLCDLARVKTSDYFGNTICGTGTGDVRIEARMFLIGVVLLAALVALGLLLVRLERRQARGEDDPTWIWQLLAPVMAAGVLLWFVGIYGPRDILFEAALPSEMIVWILLPVLLALAAVVVTARNPRRFVLGAAIFGVITFIALWPNLSAFPMPQAIIGIYNGVLPTWFYGFQFSVNLQQSAHVSIVGVDSAMCAVLALIVAGIAGWAALERRRSIGYLRAKAAGYATADVAVSAGDDD